MKSPGLDGYGSGFFQDAWPIIGNDFYIAVQEFFKIGYMNKEVNCTHLVLLPKKDCPITAADHRPIACCSVLYNHSQVASQKNAIGFAYPDK